MNYYQHKESKATIQFPEGIKKFKAIGEVLEKCERIDGWSSYLSKVIENQKRNEADKLLIENYKEITIQAEAEKNGRLIHRKYFHPYPSNIHDHEQSSKLPRQCDYCDKQFFGARNKRYCSWECGYRERNIRRIESQLGAMATVQAEPGSVGEVSGGE